MDVLQTRLPNLPTRLSEQLREIMSTWEQRRGGRRLPLYIARQNIDGIEVEFSNMLVEDANNDALSYVDYLCLYAAFSQGPTAAVLLTEVDLVHFAECTRTSSRS